MGYGLVLLWIRRHPNLDHSGNIPRSWSGRRIWVGARDRRAPAGSTGRPSKKGTWQKMQKMHWLSTTIWLWLTVCHGPLKNHGYVSHSQRVIEVFPWIMDSSWIHQIHNPKWSRVIVQMESEKQDRAGLIGPEPGKEFLFHSGSNNLTT